MFSAQSSGLSWLHHSMLLLSVQDSRASLSEDLSVCVCSRTPSGPPAVDQSLRLPGETSNKGRYVDSVGPDEGLSVVISTDSPPKGSLHLTFLSFNPRTTRGTQRATQSLPELQDTNKTTHRGADLRSAEQLLTSAGGSCK